MSCGVRPRPDRRSSPRFASHSRMRRFAGSPLAATSRRTRLDLALGSADGSAATPCRENAIVEAVTFSIPRLFALIQAA